MLCITELNQTLVLLKPEDNQVCICDKVAQFTPAEKKVCSHSRTCEKHNATLSTTIVW